MNAKWNQNIVLLLLILVFQGQAQEGSKENFSFWAYEALNLPSIDSTAQPGRKIRVAVVDDGFLLTHELLKDFICQNPTDVENNKLDDDGNGYVDDHCGWDVSDDDNDVGFPPGREHDFYHGTMIASIITTVAREVYGDRAHEYVEIIPVKAVSDYETKTYVREGYKGIRYALSQKVDVICCAWSGGELSQENKALLEEVKAAGIMLIGSTGRYFNDVLNPAAYPGMLAVSAVDTDYVRLPFANVGESVDWMGPGIKVRAGHPLDPRAYFYGDGTSASTALISGCLTVLKSRYPERSNQELIDALKYTAIPLNFNNTRFAGKLGAGLPQLSRAFYFLDHPEKRQQLHNPRQTEGKLYFHAKQNALEYRLQPNGKYEGFVFKVEEGLKKGKTGLIVNGEDSVFQITSENADKEFFLPRNQAAIYTTDRKFKGDLVVSYRPLTIDSASLYCDGVIYINQPSGTITDGSGEENYANECDCKWIIKAPVGKRIKFQFDQMDTEPNTDFVWIFEGEKTLEENVMAQFSGNNKPPVLTSQSNVVLFWFLSDNKNTGKGWRMSWELVDSEQ